MILPIMTAPNSILRKKAREIKKDELESKKIHQLVSDMIAAMREKKGIGLAAPQAGESVRLICVDARETDPRGKIEKEKYPELIYKETNLVIINPSITWRSLGKTVIEEGCLSIPGVTGNVKRPKSIRVNCVNLEGKKIKIKAKGLLARVLQHEIDHLEGVLFVDRINN